MSGKGVWWLVVQLLVILSDCSAQDPVISLPQGDIRGIRLYSTKRGVVLGFLGIPYAQPPIGPLRFRLPEMLPPSNRTFTATHFGHACPQPDLDRLRAAEDCLTLNVWVPEGPIDLKTFPVLVFLEGEMFTHSNTARYPGEDLAAEGVIVVSVNYRVNVFGFISLESPEAPGNLGLWDQHMALRWIQDNIKKFGGDPTRITLMGHGAGGASAVFHMVSPRSQGLFNRAIIMSGSAHAQWAISRRAKEATQEVAALLGCRTHHTQELLDCMRARDVRDILQALARHQKDMNTTAIFAPVIDNYLASDAAFLPRDPLLVIQKGDYRRIRVMTGVVDNEGTAVQTISRHLSRRTYDEIAHVFLTACMRVVIAQYGFRDAWEAIYRSVRYNYFDRAPLHDKPALLRQLLEFYSDAYFKAPHDIFIHALMRAGVPTYVYRYSYPTAEPFTNSLNGTGAQHGSELFYLFGPVVFRQELGVGFSRSDEATSDLLKRLWLEFVQGGDPTPNPLGLKWEVSTREELKNYEIKEQLSRSPYNYHHVSFWTDFLPSLERLARGEIDALHPDLRPSETSKFRLDPTQPYQSIMWVLIAAISILLVAFVVSLSSLRRQRSLV